MASPEMISEHALREDKESLPLYLSLVRKGMREEAIRLAMPLSYEGFIASFYHGPLRELSVSILEACKVLKKSERPSPSIILFDMISELAFVMSKTNEYGALYNAHCRLDTTYNVQGNALLRLYCAHQAGENLTFTHTRNFERKEEKVIFSAREIPLK